MFLRSVAHKTACDMKWNCNRAVQIHPNGSTELLDYKSWFRKLEVKEEQNSGNVS